MSISDSDDPKLPVYFIDGLVEELRDVPLAAKWPPGPQLEAIANEAAAHLLHIACRMHELSPQARGVIAFAIEQYVDKFHGMLDAIREGARVRVDHGPLQ
jgi:hypothetical protein